MKTIFCLLTVFQLWASEPLVWFGPQAPLVRPNKDWTGSPEYMTLFTPDAPWQNAAKHVGVFKISTFMASRAPDQDLKRMFSDLDRRGIALALETGFMHSSAACGQGVEGFGGASAVKAVQRIKSLGGKLRYIAMDEPFFYGGIYAQKNACKWSMEQVAKDIAPEIRAVRKEFPDVIIGDIEPLPGEVPGWIESYRKGIDAYREATGSDLAFFHADLPWHNVAWPDELDALRRMVEEQKIPFGIIYNSNTWDQSSAEWIANSEGHFELYESEGRRPPEHVIFQSWTPQPQKLLPDTARDSFTGLINRYFRARTRITLRRDGDSLTGNLTDESGKPLAGLPIKVTSVSSSGNGEFAEYTLSGIVPAGAVNALVGLRVNQECSCSGVAEFQLSEFVYRDDSNAAQKWDLRTGLSDLSLSNRQAAVLEPAAGLHVSAQQGQKVSLSTRAFAVKPGARYSVRFLARVAPRSFGSGYFMIFFPEAKVRNTMGIQAQNKELGTATTDRNGAFRVRTPGKSTDVEIQAQFAGNDTFRQAVAHVR